MSPHDQQFLWLEERQRFAGSFEYALIEAWRKASPTNKAILEEAFKNTPFNLKPKNP